LAELKVYPNPVLDELTVKLPFYMNKKIDIEIVNSLGKEMITKKCFSGDEIKLNVSSLKRGIYFIRCVKDKKIIKTKFIKK